MIRFYVRLELCIGLAVVTLACASCANRPVETSLATTDTQLATRGSIEITAELVEIPEGAIFQRDLYNYATILKYKVLRVHRGTVVGDVVFVGHYNPWQPRSEAVDEHVPEIGGNVRQFRAGQTHRMALEVPIDDYFMGGIVNKYFGQETEPLYWAVWTNSSDE